MLAKQSKDYHTRILDKDDNESLVTYENLISKMSNSPLTYVVNNNDQNKF